jgi:hypothetical protein
MKHWQQLNDNVADMQYPLRGFGIDFGRNVTLLRLRDGRLVIHSTAPFMPDDVAAIRGFGEPAWLVEATRMHDTFAREARLALPNVSYLAPGRLKGVPTVPLLPPPDDWNSEIEVLKIDGLRKIDEHAFFHRASRTLVLADLLFHFPPGTRGWPRFFIRHVMRLRRLLGLSLFFRLMIRDREAFARSMKKLLAWEFAQIVVAHGEPIDRAARSVFVRALHDRGLAVEG